MSQYTPTSGTILQINHNHINASQYGCELTLTLQSMDQGIVNIAISGSTYVFNHHPLKVGDSVTCFYSLLAPVPLIYPPLYRALVVVPTPAGTYASLDIYHRLSHSNQLANSDDTLILNLSRQIPMASPSLGRFLISCFWFSTAPLPVVSLHRPLRTRSSYSAQENSQVFLQTQRLTHCLRKNRESRIGTPCFIY